MSGGGGAGWTVDAAAISSTTIGSMNDDDADDSTKTQTKTTNDAGLAAAAVFYEKGERGVMSELRHAMKWWNDCFCALAGQGQDDRPPPSNPSNASFLPLTLTVVTRFHALCLSSPQLCLVWLSRLSAGNAGLALVGVWPVYVRVLGL